MDNFAFFRPTSVAEAIDLASGDQKRDFLAGGTTMVDLMKLAVQRPGGLVDITGIKELESYEIGPGRLRFGALARMAVVADDADLREACPALTEALWKAASPQLRNVARLGGNILQRTRCPYFRDTAYTQCNKRDPGSGCAALEGGVTSLHAILGGSEHCVAMYPGDWAQALIAFDAEVRTRGPGGSRTIPFADLHVLPGDSPEVETILEKGEIIISIEVPVVPAMRASHYLKARDRESYAFASASAAVGLELDGETVKDARIALGGVASVPWRAGAAEEVLRGRTFSEALAREAGRAAFADATPLEHSAYKIPLGADVVAGALMTAHARARAGAKGED
ncbi:FAD binding domain-containing protein [Marinimicrococcus flavescens]|uniref:Xanthine dehydrogenase family protein subunit M n=1 Tax=Marinimicrococcus flavescens TaxID=3031815 RepID=A0AAP3XSY7_9PROT|nr:xanthine dehydrogenase family protein subunit M [Marinimicrococcus flavescens]